MQPIAETPHTFALLDESPATKGQVSVLPKEEVVILEQANDQAVGEMFELANHLSSTLFEVLQAKGTNLLIQNGPAAGQEEPQLSMQIIPRFEEDGINLMWQANPASEEELQEYQETIIQALQAKPKMPEQILQEEESEEEKQKWIKNALFRLP